MRIDRKMAAPFFLVNLANKTSVTQRIYPVFQELDRS
jgi:hypothetical protein